MIDTDRDTVANRLREEAHYIDVSSDDSFESWQHAVDAFLVASDFAVLEAVAITAQALLAALEPYPERAGLVQAADALRTSLGALEETRVASAARAARYAAVSEPWWAEYVDPRPRSA